MSAMKNLLLATALAGSVAFAANAQGGGSGNAAPAAQGGANQRWTQEANVGGPGAQIMISPADVRLIVQALNARGYAAGQVNGAWTSAASQAAANFEATVGLEPTGTITTALIQALGLNNILTASVNPNDGGRGGAGQGGSGVRGGGLTGLDPLMGPVQNLPWLAGLPRGLSMRWTVEKADNQGTPLFISPADVRLVQQALNQKGYSAGNVHGDWDDGSRKAAADFQRANNLEPNGEIDLSLLAALGLNGVLNGQGVGGAPRQAMQIAQAGAQGGLPPTGQRRAQESATGKGTPLYLGPAGVRTVHLMLNHIGFSAGNIQSAFNQNGQTALADFQRSLGLEPTGTLTTETIAALGLAPWLQGQAAQAANTPAVGNVGGGPGGGPMNANAGGPGPGVGSGGQQLGHGGPAGQMNGPGGNAGGGNMGGGNVQPHR